jgi:hypothetical protein
MQTRLLIILGVYSALGFSGYLLYSLLYVNE